MLKYIIIDNCSGHALLGVYAKTELGAMRYFRKHYHGALATWEYVSAVERP